jgi:predicted O-methyltransferase YrrM
MYHNTTTYTDLFLHKTKNISNIVLPSHIRNVMEIGFNSGFSALLMLLSNPHITLTCVDLGEHRYTYPCFLQLKKTFGNRIRLILGDSTSTLPKHEGIYDAIHIDGGHSTEVAQSDITHSLRLSRKGTVLIMNDYDFPNLHQLWDKSVDQYKLSVLDTYVYPTPHHDVKYVFTQP